MSITVQLDIPDDIAKKAEASGLLQPGSLTDMLQIELRRREAAADLNRVLDEIRAQPGEPMSLDEIQAEVKAVRKAMREREAGN
jgi:hypothetical protein